jgi:hypothetical protein
MDTPNDFDGAELFARTSIELITAAAKAIREAESHNAACERWTANNTCLRTPVGEFRGFRLVITRGLNSFVQNRSGSLFSFQAIAQFGLLLPFYGPDYVPDLETHSPLVRDGRCGFSLSSAITASQLNSLRHPISFRTSLACLADRIATNFECRRWCPFGELELLHQDRSIHASCLISPETF